MGQPLCPKALRGQIGFEAKRSRVHGGKRLVLTLSFVLVWDMEPCFK